ncbi:MAG TPA: c-type cytochrome [Terriglobales bacterium]|nr:c-type cytochrome [Terriglobales bacterium]
MRWRPLLLNAGVAATVLLLVVLSVFSQSPAPATTQAKRAEKRAVPVLPTSPIPAGPAGASIRRGQNIFDYTPRYAARYVGNRMNCADCHLQSGRAPYSGPMVGLTHIYPTYNDRAGQVISLARRIQQCFVRSENGRPPAPESKEMQALLAYIGWLSRDHPKGSSYPGQGLVDLPQLHGDRGRGATIYGKQCAVCHGADGAGVPPVLPPLWGPNSFNDGAGMSTVEAMAAFVQYNMPQDAPGTLSAQQAYDVAAYVNSKPRPKMNPAYEKY